MEFFEIVFEFPRISRHWRLIASLSFRWTKQMWNILDELFTSKWRKFGVVSASRVSTIVDDASFRPLLKCKSREISAQRLDGVNGCVWDSKNKLKWHSLFSCLHFNQPKHTTIHSANYANRCCVIVGGNKQKTWWKSLSMIIRLMNHGPWNEAAKFMGWLLEKKSRN